jgi:hypothetical protein
MSYQAVIRNSSDQLVANHVVGMQISILQGSATGIVVYSETQTPTTNANGLITIEIGDGTQITGAFAAINWSTGTYFIKTEIDPVGSTNYSIIGTNQLLSVPYAIYAKASGTADYNSLTNKPVDIKFPDGLHNLQTVIITNTYTVPSSKNLYITNFSGTKYTVDGIVFSNEPFVSYISFILPQIVGENSFINDISGSLIGFIVDKQIATPILNNNYPYTVPANKTLFILGINYNNGGNGVNLIIDGSTITDDAINYKLNTPIIVQSGQVLNSTSVTKVIFWGDLIDSNQF